MLMGIPVTVFLLSVMLFTYIRSPQFVEDSCIPNKFGQLHFDLDQWFISLFHHSSRSHFAYQIVSILWKGTFLEGYSGSRRFVSIILELLLVDQGMVLVAWQGWKLMGAADIYPFICHDQLLRLGFCMYAFLLPAYQKQSALTMVAILFTDLTIIYMLYPVKSLSGAVIGTLLGLVWSYGPQLVYSSWIMAWRSCSSTVIEMAVSSDTRKLIRKCKFCRSENGVILDVCESCGISNGCSASGASIMNSPQSALISRMSNPELEKRNLVWNCKSCTFENELFVPVCEICGAPNITFGLKGMQGP